VTTVSKSSSSGSDKATLRVEETLREAATAIGAARTLLDQGHVVDLKGLEAHVDGACSAIAALPREKRLPLKPALVALIDGLNALADHLSVQHKELTAALTGIGARRNALSAYGKPPKR
jgi:hydrogenase maturation factor HypF (carbamoyltransferase family)